MLSSSAFNDGEPIPEPYGYTEDNINPPLSIGGIPDETESLALIMDDPDAMEPAGKIWDHWVVWNIDPSTNEIPEDWTVTSATEGENDYEEPGYGGPNPPDREHTYYFKLYALDTSLDLDAGSKKEDLESAMKGHILDEAELTGTYTP
jgi:Raf kinase inhibitor-like YbhB/YbcL family protein